VQQYRCSRGVIRDTRNKEVLKCESASTSCLVVTNAFAKLNILFFSIIPFVFIFSQNKLLRKLFVLSFLVVIIFTYPVYNLLTSTSIGDKIIESRYESGDDASARLRLMLFGTIVKEASTMNFSEHLMGLGAEHSRLLIEKEFLYDIQPHNDVIRIYVDFGIIFTVIFLSLYYRLSITSNQLALLFCLYLLSFFHNMIYNYYIPTLIFVFDNLHRKKLTSPKRNHGKH